MPFSFNILNLSIADCAVISLESIPTIVYFG